MIGTHRRGVQNAQLSILNKFYIHDRIIVSIILNGLMALSACG